MSLKQLLTIWNQLHVGMYETKLDQKEEWLALGGDSEGFYVDEALRKIECLAREWIVSRRRSEQLPDLTRAFLRDNVSEWTAYESDLRWDDLFNRANKFQNGNYDFGFGSDEAYMRCYIKDLESYVKKEKELVNEFYPKISKKNKDKWPLGWMLKNKGIREAMEKKKGQRRVRLFNELWRRKMSFTESKTILSGMKIKEMGLRIWLSTFRGEKLNPVLVQVDMALMGNKLGDVSAETVRSDVGSLEKAGALRKIGKPGPHEHSVYVVGTAITYYLKDSTGIGVKKIRTVPLLKKSPHAQSKLTEAFQ